MKPSNFVLKCSSCGKEAMPGSFRCKICNSILEVKMDYGNIILPKNFKKQHISTKKYLDLFPIRSIHVGGKEGHTPIVHRRIKGLNLAFKLETGNPTHSFKDRGSVIEINKAIELGFDKACCASTGNMGISIAYYSKLAGIDATVFISNNADKKKIGMIKQHGAEVIKVDGDFNKALDSAEGFARKSGAFVCGDYHYRKEGQKSLIYEIIEQFRYSVPDYVFLPVGNATLLAAMYKGLIEFRRFSLIKKFPKLVAIQSEKCSPLVNAFNSGRKIVHLNPRTIADAIAVGYPTFGFEGIEAIKKTNGMAVSVSDDEICGAVNSLREMKIGSEPGGAAGFAGFVKLQREHAYLLNRKRIVVLITGNN